MRRHLVVTIAAATLLAAAVPARAELIPQFGLKGGVNLSDINLDDLDASTRTGWVGGVYLDLASPLLHLQPEALVTSKGFEGGALSPTNHSLDYRSTWLEIPVLVMFALPIPSISPRAYVGPAVSFPLQSEVRVDDGDWTDIGDQTQSTWSVVAGVGVTLGPIGLEVRYDVGMTEINEEPLGTIVESVPDDLQGKDIEDRTWSVLMSIGL